MVFLLRWLTIGHRRHAAALLGGALLVVLAGGALFAATQHLALTTGWYWAVTTATTVGYGDVTPKDAAGRIVASAVMLTAIPMVGAAFALATGSVVSERLRRLLTMSTPLPEGGYRLVVGMGPAIPTVLEELVRTGSRVVLVADVDPATLPAGVHLVRGDPTSARAVAAADPARAADGVVAGASDGDVLVSAVLVREQAPELPLTALAGASSVAEALRALGIARVLSADRLLAHTVAKTLEAPHAGDLLVRLVGSEQNRLVEEAVPAASAPRPLSAVREERGELVLGVVRGGELSLGVGEDPEVGPGDVLLVVVPADRPDVGG